MSRHLAGAALLLAGSAWAGTPYYLTDNFASIDGSRWTAAGSLAARSGLAAVDANGGSLVSRIPIPDGSGEAEVRMVIALGTSGGTFTAFVRATPDARTAAGAASGTYLALEMQNPQFDDAGRCLANFLLFESRGGSVSLLGAFQHACRNGMELRLAVHGGVALVWPDQATPMEFAVTAGGTGQPGIGAYGTPNGNAISLVQLGTIDRAAPAAIDPQTIGAAVFRTHVDLQWKGVAEPANGSGLAGYWIYRDGLYLGRTQETQFSDETVSAGEKHSYSIRAVNQHYNFSAPSTVTVSVPVPVLTPAGPLPFGLTPPPLPAPAPHAQLAEMAEAPRAPIVGTPQADSGGGLDPRRVGVRALGSYWGAAGEQIDMLSGNLNFSVPLIKAQNRGGWSVTFALSYNSQMWRLDGAGTWLLGKDVGYGLGWKLQAGSITPIWTAGGLIDHYLYTDSTGADYSLSQNSGGVWRSLEGVYVAYDANAGRLYFPDGSFWVMGCTSAGGEQDSGSRYPTQMEDTNGNYLTIEYGGGSGSGLVNTSARITKINDVRNAYSSATYTFSYSTDAFPHLTRIENSIGTGETYWFYYLSNQPVSSPFTQASYGTAALLQSVFVYGIGSHGFQYGTGSGEMTQYTTPLGGILQWQYRSFTYAGGIRLREVQNRYMQPLAGGATNTWAFTRDDAGDAGRPCHYWTAVADMGANSWKSWAFYLSGPEFAKIAYYYELTSLASSPQFGNWAELLTKVHGWTVDPSGNVYLGWVVAVWNSGTSFAAVTTTAQGVDLYGNVTLSQVYDYGSATPTRTYNYHYVGPCPVNPYMRNRLTSVTVSGIVPSLVWNIYDGGSLLDRYGLPLHDAAYDSIFTCRGNVTQSTTLKGSKSYMYDTGGVVTQVTDAAGQSVSVTASAATGYSLPGVLTPNGTANLATSISYATSFAATSVTGPNGATATTTYDSYGRPSQTTIPDGAATTYTYTSNTQTATLGTRWKKTTLDGFGRVTRVESGHDQTTVSTVDTQYAPCACSPLGKLWRVSQPYAPGGTPVWTTYTYDAAGRTLTVTAPDGSVTSYSYQGNQRTVTDPAGKWKTYTTDAYGNLTLVTEPNPAGGANLTTSYTYNSLNLLTQVSMPRSNGTQTRTFVYSGADLTSATNPENGTVTYTYDVAHRVSSRTDAKGQQTQYSYDSYGRLTQVSHYPSATSGEDVNQRVYYRYDTGLNGWGRLTSVQFVGRDWGGWVNAAGTPIVYTYSYNRAGRLIGQGMSTTMAQEQYSPSPLSLTAGYQWDNEGRMTSLRTPSLVWRSGPGQWYTETGPVLANQFDAMGRVSGMTEDDNDGNGPQAVASAGYGTAGELLNLTYYGMNETRSYNSLLQVTRMRTVNTQDYQTAMDMEYLYPAGHNNGRTGQSLDHVTGESVTYSYDPLNRLTGAATADNLWGQAYSYDGFGNLTGKTVTKGSAPSLSVAYDPATNRQVGVSYDANGNEPGDIYNLNGWDVENRLVQQGSQGGTRWVYDPWGKRVEKNVNVDPWGVSGDGYYAGTWEFYFYGIGGRKLAAASCSYQDAQSLWCSLSGRNVYFGGKLVGVKTATAGVQAVVTDRLGSVRMLGAGSNYPPQPAAYTSYFPYGEERTATGDGREKFGTYIRDGAGQDYAEQRYYTVTKGRFWSPEAGGLSGVHMRSPRTWNRYAYVGGDPVNFADSDALLMVMPTGGCIPDPFDEGFGEGCALGGAEPLTPNPPSPPPIPQTPPTKGVPAPRRYRPLGYNGALLDLSKPDCYGMLGFDSAGAAQEAFSDITFQAVQLGTLEVEARPDGGLNLLSGDGHPVAATGAVPNDQNPGGVITINANVFWVDLSKVTAKNITSGQQTTIDLLLVWNNALGSTMTTSDLTNMILLHEFKHVLGAGQEFDPVAFNSPIVEKCIK